jgi:hypothetical protein
MPFWAQKLQKSDFLDAKFEPIRFRNPAFSNHCKNYRKNSLALMILVQTFIHATTGALLVIKYFFLDPADVTLPKWRF